MRNLGERKSATFGNINALFLEPHTHCYTLYDAGFAGVDLTINFDSCFILG